MVLKWRFYWQSHSSEELFLLFVTDDSGNPPITLLDDWEPVRGVVKTASFLPSFLCHLRFVGNICLTVVVFFLYWFFFFHNDWESWLFCLLSPGTIVHFFPSMQQLIGKRQTSQSFQVPTVFFPCWEPSGTLLICLNRNMQHEVNISFLSLTPLNLAQSRIFLYLFSQRLCMIGLNLMSLHHRGMSLDSLGISLHKLSVCFLSDAQIKGA